MSEHYEKGQRVIVTAGGQEYEATVYTPTPTRSVVVLVTGLPREFYTNTARLAPDDLDRGYSTLAKANIRPWVDPRPVWQRRLDAAMEHSASLRELVKVAGWLGTDLGEELKGNLPDPATDRWADERLKWAAVEVGMTIRQLILAVEHREGLTPADF